MRRRSNVLSRGSRVDGKKKNMKKKILKNGLISIAYTHYYMYSIQ